MHENVECNGYSVDTDIVGNKCLYKIALATWALFGGWLIGPLLGAGSINDGITFMSFVVSLIGAVILLAILSFFQRNTTH